MPNENDVILDSSPENGSETDFGEITNSDIASEGVKTPDESATAKEQEKTVPYKRFQEVNEELTKLKKEGKPKSQADNSELLRDSKILSKYDELDADFLIDEAKLRGISIRDAEKLEHIQLAIEARKRKVAEQNKVPASSSPRQSSFNKEIRKDTSQEDADAILRERFQQLQEKDTGI